MVVNGTNGTIFFVSIVPSVPTLMVPLVLVVLY